MAEVTRVISIEVTVIDDERTFGMSAEQVVEFWKDKFSDVDDVHVTVKDFILEDCND